MASSSWNHMGVRNKQLYFESESYFNKVFNFVMKCKQSLKWVKLVRVAEHFIKIESRAHND